MEINIILKPCQVQKHNRPKIYNTWALPTLLHRCATQAITEHDKSKIMSAEMKFMRGTAKCTWQDYKTNADILSKLKLVKKIRNYRNIWIQNVWRMDRDRQTTTHNY